MTEVQVGHQGDMEAFRDMPDDDIQYMKRCLELACRGQFGAHPNPMVGCVLVRDGQVVGEGWHALCGEDHAEVGALEEAGERARGATLYVTLEPCSHWGRTGPCVERVIKAGVARVVYGMLDPNPKVAGGGLARLHEAGVSVSGPLLEAEAEALNPGFIKRMRHGLPYLRCKLAMSLDGRTAMASGESKWITGIESREDVQAWRARSGAILTGVDTVLADDPSLNVRLQDPRVRQPLRVIVDSALRTPPGARILQPPEQAVIATAMNPADTEKAASRFSRQLRLLPLPGDGGKVNLSALLAWLGGEGECNEVLLECGARLAGAMLVAGLVDELLVYIAPKLLGSEARPLFALPGISKMSESIALETLEVGRLGDDCRLRYRVRPRPAPVMRPPQ